MRIISQDGKIDLPYESVCLAVNYRDGKREILSFNCLFGSEYDVIATYSTEEKAVKAMKIMQNKYKYNERLFQFPKDDEIEV